MLLPASCADVRVERLACAHRFGAQRRHRHAEDRVRAEPALGRRAVERDHRLVELALRKVLALDRRCDLAVDVGDGLAHALAEVARLVAVAQLERFALAGRGARRHAGASARAAVEGHFDFHRRIPARVENLAAMHVNDFHIVNAITKVTKDHEGSITSAFVVIRVLGFVVPSILVAGFIPADRLPLRVSTPLR